MYLGTSQALRKQDCDVVLEDGTDLLVSVCARAAWLKCLSNAEHVTVNLTFLLIGTELRLDLFRLKLLVRIACDS